jgi:hypothetical protein
MQPPLSLLSLSNAPQTTPIGPHPHAKAASIAAGASVLALAVPQAAQAAQEAFMIAEVRCIEFLATAPNLPGLLIKQKIWSN